eukprot:12007728-Prorocentrum_lima.AAC.1
MADAADDERAQALQAYRQKIQQHRELEARVKTMRSQIGELSKQYEKTEDDLKALQSVGQIIGEVLKQLDEEKFI